MNILCHTKQGGYGTSHPYSKGGSIYCPGWEAKGLSGIKTVQIPSLKQQNVGYSNIRLHYTLISVDGSEV